MNLRLAMGLPALKNALKDLIPDSAVGAAMRLGPELVSAGMMAANVPGEDVDLMTRLGVAGEELLVSLGLSAAGSLAGRGIAGARFDRMRKNGKLGAEQLQDIGLARRNAQLTGVSLGDAAVLPAQFMAPRPLYESLYRRAVDQQQQQQAVQTAEQETTNQELVDLLLATGAAAGLATSPLGSGTPRLIVN